MPLPLVLAVPLVYGAAALLVWIFGKKKPKISTAHQESLNTQNALTAERIDAANRTVGEVGGSCHYWGLSINFAIFIGCFYSYSHTLRIP